IDVIPIFGRVVGWLGETIVERLIKRLDRGSDGSFPVVAQGSKLHDKNQPRMVIVIGFKDSLPLSPLIIHDRASAHKRTSSRLRGFIRQSPWGNLRAIRNWDVWRQVDEKHPIVRGACAKLWAGRCQRAFSEARAPARISTIE